MMNKEYRTKPVKKGVCMCKKKGIGIVKVEKAGIIAFWEALRIPEEIPIIRQVTIYLKWLVTRPQLKSLYGDNNLLYYKK